MLVTQLTHYDIADALVAQFLLAHHGIPVFLFDDRLGRMSRLYLFALGGVCPMVPERDPKTAARTTSSGRHPGSSCC